MRGGTLKFSKQRVQQQIYHRFLIRAYIYTNKTIIAVPRNISTKSNCIFNVTVLFRLRFVSDNVVYCVVFMQIMCLMDFHMQLFTERILCVNENCFNITQFAEWTTIAKRSRLRFLGTSWKKVVCV